MPTLEIIREQPKPREIRMGQASRPLDLEPRAANPLIPDAPPGQTVKNKGRKKMTDKKLDHESGGPETIREDKAGEQGAIGSHGVNAPAQTKVPESEKSEKEGKSNG